MIAAPLLDRRLVQPLPRWRFSEASRPVVRRSIGLLGGSFNPAHDGHRQISLEALRRLQLDEVWWLVSPQNPLKSTEGMAPFSERMRAARAVGCHPRIRISDQELRFGSSYTRDTISRLTSWKSERFVFLLGADNLAQLHLWKRWDQLAALVPIAVFDRSPYSRSAMTSHAANFLANSRLPSQRAAELKSMEAPVWCFLHMRPHPGSSTAIRRIRSSWWRDSWQ